MKIVDKAGIYVPDVGLTRRARPLRRVRRLMREAQIMDQLRHPGIVRLRDVAQSKAEVFLGMDYVPGFDGRRSLAALIEQDAPMREIDAHGLFLQLMRTVAYMASRGVVHRCGPGRDRRRGRSLTGSALPHAPHASATSSRRTFSSPRTAHSE